LKGTITMIATLGIALLGMFLMQSTKPPNIAGNWSGEGWGQVVLTQTAAGKYAGTYRGTVGKEPGKIQLEWSRIQRRFNGTWREGEDCFGELTIRLADNEIHGARSTDPKSNIDPATPRLADFVWARVEPTTNSAEAKPVKATFGPVVKGLQAAVELQRPEGGFALGKAIRVRFHIRNASNKSIYLAGGSWRQDSRIKVEDEQGQRIPVRHVMYTGETLIQRNLLEPGDSALFHSSSLAFIAEAADVERVGHPVGNYVQVKPGRYTVRYLLHFPDVVEGRPGGPPRYPEDWHGDLETAPVTVDVKAPPRH
jgi:hypothetical protein